MWLEDYEVINPIRLRPKWSPQLPIQVPKSRAKAIEAISSARSEVMVFSDGSAIDGRVGTAAVLCRDGEVKAVLWKYLGPKDRHTVFEVEAVGLVLAAELVRAEETVCTVTIGADSQAVIHASCNIKGESGQYLVDMVHEWMMVVKSKHRGLNTELWWTLGHEGIPGNEWEDAEAKKAV